MCWKQNRLKSDMTALKIGRGKQNVETSECFCSSYSTRHLRISILGNGDLFVYILFQLPYKRRFLFIYIYIYIFGFLQKSANVYLLDIPPAPVFLRDPGIVQTVESCIKSSFSTVEIIDQVLIPVCCGKAGR